MKTTVPLIISNYNQLYYTINLINWWNFKTESNPVYIVDNGSTYKPLLDFYKNNPFKNVKVIKCKENNMKKNVEEFLNREIHKQYKHYCVSDPDISPLPDTPFNFLDIFKSVIEDYGYDHVGFALKLDDLPDWYPKKGNAIAWEQQFSEKPLMINYDGEQYQGYEAPIDFTFSMWSSKKGGWGYPIDRDRWHSSLRVLEAHHLGWYLPEQAPNKEMANYYKTARTSVQNEKDELHGANNWNPSHDQQLSAVNKIEPVKTKKKIIKSTGDMKHTEIINDLIKKNNYKSYLEIGVHRKHMNFDHIEIPFKIGVDPDHLSEAEYITTSDQFFTQLTNKFDIIFVDGLHHADQALKDIENSLKFLNDGGTIVVHDCSPTSYEMQTIPMGDKEVWTGDTWKAWMAVRSRREDVTMDVVDTDWGCGIIQKGHQKPFRLAKFLDYKYLEEDRVNMLNLISVNEFKKKYL